MQLNEVRKLAGLPLLETPEEGKAMGKKALELWKEVKKLIENPKFEKAVIDNGREYKLDSLASAAKDFDEELDSIVHLLDHPIKDEK